MKKIAFVLLGALLIGTTACNNASNSAKSGDENSVSPADVENQGTPKFDFADITHDFGTITEGDTARYDFKFKNTGDAPLIITNTSASCGCTVPEWPREPIAPGESGVIHVEFHSQGHPGQAEKEIRINANTVPNLKVLRIIAYVKSKDKQ